MPVTKTSTLSYTFLSATANLDGPSCSVTFKQALDGVPTGEVCMVLQGDQFNALFGVSGDASKTRAVDLADAIYAAALAQGVIQGNVS
jgi:hypothetical protein